jgi:hypothetical protein
MSVAEIYETVVRGLPENDQRALAETINRHLDQRVPKKPRITWREMRGRIPVNSMGEDAQEWVSRTRREASERSDCQLTREQ